MAIRDLRGVLCCGNICYDIPVWPVEKIAWGTTTWVETITESLGGNGANTSYALARLGVPVSLVGVVGSDSTAARAVETLRSAGVDVARIRSADLPTTSTICVVHPSGDRLFLHRPGASSALEASAIEFEPALHSHFHLANPFSLPKLRPDAGDLMRRARDRGFSTSLDTGWDALGRWIADIGPCLPFTDVLFVNGTEAGMLTGIEDHDGAAAALLDLGTSTVVLKTGCKGCSVYRSDGRLEVPTFTVPVVDTTGAGDCFAGGFLAALSRGFDFAAAAKFANAVGALNVQCLGAAQGIVSFEETERWIATRSTLGSS